MRVDGVMWRQLLLDLQGVVRVRIPRRPRRPKPDPPVQLTLDIPEPACGIIESARIQAMTVHHIIKRFDGSRVRITLSGYFSYGPDRLALNGRVDLCKPGKRTWVPVVEDHDYNHRKLKSEDRPAYVRGRIMDLVSPVEIDEAIRAFWEKLPTADDITWRAY